MKIVWIEDKLTKRPMQITIYPDGVMDELFLMHLIRAMAKDDGESVITIQTSEKKMIWKPRKADVT